MPQGDAVKEADTVPVQLDKVDGEDIIEPDGLCVALLRLVTDALKDEETVGDEKGRADTLCDTECVPQDDAE